MITRIQPRRISPLCALLIALVIGAASAARANAGIAIEWDPSQDPTVVGYRVSVGTSPGVYTETFDVGSATSFAYEAPGSGTYFLAVASYAEGPVVGPLSAPLTAIIQGVSSSPASSDAPGDVRSFYEGLWRDAATPTRNGPRFTVAEAAGIAARAPTTVCWVASSDCLIVRTVARSNAEISSLTIGPDNRQYFVEGHRQVRMIASNTLQADPVLVAVSSATRLNQLALDPNFAATGLMYVSETAVLANGDREFRLVRYRVIGGQAGNRSIVFSTILPSSGDAWFVSSAGYFFVAVPGVILRLNMDGSVPPEQRGSAVYAAGYASPTAIAFDGGSERLWLAGVDDRGQASLTAAGGLFSPALTPITSLSTAETDASYLFFTFASGLLGKARVEANGRIGSTWQLAIADGVIRDVVAAASGDLFVSVEKQTSSGVPATSVLRLVQAQ